MHNFICIYVTSVYSFLMKCICQLNSCLYSYIPSHEADYSISLDKKGMHFSKVCQFMKFSSV